MILTREFNQYLEVYRLLKAPQEVKNMMAYRDMLNDALTTMTTLGGVVRVELLQFAGLNELKCEFNPVLNLSFDTHQLLHKIFDLIDALNFEFSKMPEGQYTLGVLHLESMTYATVKMNAEFDWA